MHEIYNFQFCVALDLIYKYFLIVYLKFIIGTRTNIEKLKIFPPDATENFFFYYYYKGVVKNVWLVADFRIYLSS